MQRYPARGDWHACPGRASQSQRGMAEKETVQAPSPNRMDRVTEKAVTSSEDTDEPEGGK